MAGKQRLPEVGGKPDAATEALRHKMMGGDKQPDALALADALETFHNPHDRQAAAELRRLHDENEALKAAQYECGFGAGCCYQAAKSEADEVLLRQVLEDICGAKLCEVNSMSSRAEARRLLDKATNALRERLGETK